MKVQRGQHGNVEECWDLNISDGQHGKGIYTFPFNDVEMQKYYTKQGAQLYTFEIPSNLVYDMSHLKLDYWDARKIIANNPNYKAFIFNHSGFGIPSSKEILITDPEIITNIE